MKKIILVLALASVSTLFGREKASVELTNQTAGAKVMANCVAPDASKELWWNNVRTILFSGGDMWWDRKGTGNAYYYVPAVQNKNTGASSLFAGSIWLGGVDESGALKVAAMTYRQNGIDFWSGPLDTTNAAADPATCSKYDQIFQVTRTEVDMLVKNKGPVTANITQWPGNGDVSLKQGKRLAPFVDVNFDGVYDPTGSDPDYPAYDVYDRAETDALGVCKSKLFGDYTLFWVFNDNGGIHTETQGVPLGVEVRAQAFAFKTNDEINNMTFYSYEIFNRSSFQLNKTYFSVWTDADLGYFLDDYVGCDVKKGLGYIYNADPFDETAMGTNGYGDYPPALGCDFFRGPLADIGDKLDNDMDGIVDEAGETIQMSRFTYYNNNYGAFPPQTTNPAIAIHYYNYMTGFWKDSSPFTQGGNAYGGTTPATFIYDGNPVTNTGWTERGSGNTPGDRRFIQSAGPFTLKPGAVNEITFGCPWAQSSSKGGNLQSLELLFNADVKAQALFDNCFKLLDGPEAPNMTIQEMENELIVYLTNEKGTNNYKQFNNDYAEEDVTITSDPSSSIPGLAKPDKTYRFEGYIVYQVLDDKVTSNDLDDKTKAKQIFQCDLANGVTRLINYEQDNVLGAEVPTLKVDGADQGITTTFRVTEDAFSTLENRKLVNNKQYFFIAVAYAYNQYLKYKPDQPVNNADPNQTENSMGQKRPYLEGRKSKRASATPHNTDMEKGGTLANSAYGFGPKITRVEGQGNGGNILTLTQESEDAIVKDYWKEQITYENAQGPINIKVVDPLNVKDSEFSFRFINSKMDSLEPTGIKNAMSKTPKGDTLKGTMATLNIETTSWELKDLNTGKIYRANDIAAVHDPKDVYYQTIKIGNEFYFQDLGFSVTVKQVSDPGERVNRYIDYSRTSLIIDSIYKPEPNAFLGARMGYSGGTANWLNSVPDVEGYTPYNWILSGTNKTDDQEDAFFKKVGTEAAFYDPDKQFAKILGGTWAPYALCASYYSITPGPTNVSPTRIFAGPGFTSKIWSLDKNFGNLYNGQAHTAGASPGPGQGNTDLRKLSSTVIVFTRDKSKWTRCVVLEMQEKSDLSEGNAVYFQPRKHASVDKNGVSYGSPNATADAALTSTAGMGWFPGYAINIETGERLNMAFGEDSYQKENNGNDMIWNPTEYYNFPYPYAMGGKHFVYVFAGNSVESKFYNDPNANTKFAWFNDLDGKDFGVGRYDMGKRLMTIMNAFFTYDNLSNTLGAGGFAPLNVIERDIMWVSIPMPASGFGFKTPDLMPSDVKFQINVSKPYRPGFSGMASIPNYTATQLINMNKPIAVNSPSLLPGDIKTVNVQNNNFPFYNFNTSDIATLYNQSQVTKNALDRVMVVPNPYYGSSSYEINRTDNKIRITNLPDKCTIKIFTMNGTLVRTIKRDVTGQEDIYLGTSAGGNDIKTAKRTSFVEWDLKNQSNISIASGLYIIHIDAPGVGEKILKWFGVMRPLDVQSY